VTGGSRLDVFAREKHPGFAQFGNEFEKFQEDNVVELEVTT
jgi:N6-adenosine-specific RNA methylase IME4